MKPTSIIPPRSKISLQAHWEVWKNSRADSATITFQWTGTWCDLHFQINFSYLHLNFIKTIYAPSLTSLTYCIITAIYPYKII